MPKFLFAAALLSCLLGRASHAQDAAPEPAAPAADDGVHLTPKDKIVFGNGGYRSDDASLSLDLPKGFGLSADWSFYKSNSSSFTQTFGAGASAGGTLWDASSLYSWSPLQNDTESHSFELDASVHTPSKAWRTTAGVDASIADNFQYLRIPNKATTTEEITQRKFGVSLKQKLDGDTRLSAAVDFYDYNQPVEAYTLRLAQREAVLSRTHPKVFNAISGSVNGLSGLVSGFPNWSLDLGLRRDVDALPVPVTARADYENTRYFASYSYSPPTLPIHSLADGVTSDSETYALDADLTDALTATLQYNHVRQTGQTAQDLYGLSASYEF